ncbi:MAG TPA: S8 family peptidase [Bryobacteraceae bacterium]
MKSFLISPPVQEEIDQQANARQTTPTPIPVIITLNESKTDPAAGVEPSRARVKEILDSHKIPFRESQFYVFASLTPDVIYELGNEKDSVYQIWKDEKCTTHILSSADTIKASACWRTFEARGKGITWGILDTGIRSDHPHFQQFNTIDQQLSRNFSNSQSLEDSNGHGTHVAGIVAGARCAPTPPAPIKAAIQIESQLGNSVIELSGYPSGMAPLAKLVNLKVLDDDGSGSASNCILALEYVRKLNTTGRSIRIDGINMSLGYPFDPRWYGCGKSPLCQEVTRTVNSGCMVVISCGNSGYGVTRLNTGEEVPTWIALSITDPANTESAIAVGSTHKAQPHAYGVSYFSSKGPTGDGRMKPDLVAPGEKVISCSIELDQYEYEERSGTSMAAPHVSGAIAAFLSAHMEYRGDPYKVKEIFLKTATDLGRAPNFQGAGFVDLMRAIMSV